MLRFRRYREFVALTLLVGLLFVFNLYQDGGYVQPPQPKPFNFVHEAKEAKPIAQAEVPSIPISNIGANGRPHIPSDDHPRKALDVQDVDKLALGSVVFDGPPVPKMDNESTPSPAPAPAQGREQARLEEPLMADKLDKSQSESVDDSLVPKHDDSAPAAASKVNMQTNNASPHDALPPPSRAERYPISSTVSLPLGTPVKIPRVQFDFSDKQESQEAAAARLTKLAAIKDATSKSWKHYKEKAWLHDEIKPVSGSWADPFGGLAATLVDSLDTLYIMDMDEEFQEALTAVGQLDFKAYAHDTMPVFEVVIRYLGGLLGTYDISGAKHGILLAKAVELGDYLLAAFDTPNRMPITVWDHRKRQKARADARTNLAEVGSLLVEFTRLAQLTKEPKYYDVVARVNHALQTSQEETNLPGMWSLDIDVSGCERSGSSSAMDRSRGRQAAFAGDFMPTVTDDVAPVQSTLREAVDSPQQKNVAQTSSTEDDADREMLLSTEKDGAAKQAHSKDGELEDLMLAIERKAKEAVLKSDASDASDGAKDTSNKGGSKLKKRQLKLPDDSNDKAAMIPTKSEDQCVKQPPLVELTNREGVYVYSLGSRADSTYEYLPKQYVLLGGLDKTYETMYTRAADVASGALLFKPMTPDGDDILFSGKLGIQTGDQNKHHFLAEATHLGCFAGGMYAYGAKLFDRPDDLAIAKKLTEGCVWAYSVMPSGIMPEEMILSVCDSPKNCIWDEDKFARDRKDDRERGIFGTGRHRSTAPMSKPVSHEKTSKDEPSQPKTGNKVDSNHLLEPAGESEQVDFTNDRVKPVIRSQNDQSSSGAHDESDTKSQDKLNRVDDRRSKVLSNKGPPKPVEPENNDLKKRQLEDLEEEQAPKAKKAKERKASYEETEFYNLQGETASKGEGQSASNGKEKVVAEDDDMRGGLEVIAKGNVPKVAPQHGNTVKMLGNDPTISRASSKLSSTESQPRLDELEHDTEHKKATETPIERQRKGEEPQSESKSDHSWPTKQSTAGFYPEGVVSIRAPDYRLRPEAIESVWYLYRITGDEHWREVGWRMWQAIEKATSTTYGFSALLSVQEHRLRMTDKTESFWIAETLKYFYLLFADENVVSLDDWVLNTEAHPFKRPTATSW